MEAFGTVRHATRCEGRRSDLTAAAAHWHRTTYREADRTFVCRPCHGLSLSIATARRILQRAEAFDARIPEAARGAILEAGSAGVRSWPIVRAIFKAWSPVRGLHPDRRAAAERRTARAAARTELVDLGRAMPLPARRRNGLYAAAWRRGTRWQVGQCRGCGRLVMSRASHPTSMHMACVVAARRTPKGRKYLRDRWQARRDGLDALAAWKRLGGPPVAEVKTRKDPTTLKRNLGWAVRHYLGDETQEAIAAGAGVTRQNVTRAMAETMALLPDPAIADRSLRPLVVALQEARDRVSELAHR